MIPLARTEIDLSMRIKDVYFQFKEVQAISIKALVVVDKYTQRNTPIYKSVL